jgi:hypothetical protein
VKIYLSTCVLGFLIYSNAQSQTISYSPYSYYGIGILKERTSALNRSLAETGIGIRDNININSLNPASYTSIQAATQVAEMGMFYESSKLETTKLTQAASNGNMTSLNLWFRFHKKWAGMVGLSPFSFVNYNIDIQKEFIEGELTNVTYSGKSGLSQFYFGNAFQVTKHLSIGANISYVFGSLEKEEQVNSGRSFGLLIKDKIYLNKLGIDWGAQYSININKNILNIGLTYSNKMQLNTTSELRVSERFGQDSLFTRTPTGTNYVLPTQVGIGLAYQSVRSTIVADLKYKNWKEASLEKSTALRNTYRFSAGYEYKGNPKSVRYIDAISLRAGVYFQNNYLILNNKPFHEWGYTFGAGLPLNRNRGSLNLSYSFNQSGTKEKGLILQQSDVLVIDVIFRDLWGIRRKFD